MLLIDTHHHLWQYSEDEYGWINEKMSKIKKDFLTPQLKELADDNQCDGFITVQVRQTIEENDALLEYAKQEPLIRGIVGWLPFADRSVASLIEQYTSQKLIKGFRHVVQDEPDDQFLLRDDFNRGIAELAKFNSIYEILIYSRQLPASIEFIDRHPTQRFVLNHIAKPTIIPGQFDQTWESNLRELAKRDYVDCKFSGIVTEVRSEEWSIDTIRPYWDVALEAFTPKRLMFGSDWPVCLLSSEYDRWLSVVRELASSLSLDEQADFFGGNANRIYQLEL